jgi:hypothetical protein
MERREELRQTGLTPILSVFEDGFIFAYFGLNPRERRILRLELKDY